MTALADRRPGTPELPRDHLRRIRSGEHPLKVWREFRRMRIAELSIVAELSADWIEKVEAGLRQLTARQTADLARALGARPADIADPRPRCSFALAGLGRTMFVGGIPRRADAS